MIEFRIQEKTRSLNESFRGNWRPRAAVAKRQRTKAMQACPRWPGGPLLSVRLTRVSPGTLDSEDNLRGALKHVRDGVASRLKVDDASPLVDWHYYQTKGQAEVVVQIWATTEEVPPLPMGEPVERKRPALPSERVSKALRSTMPEVVATLAKDHGRPAERKRGRKAALRAAGVNLPKAPRAARPAYTPPEAKRMREETILAAAESIAQAEDRHVLRAVAAAKEAEAFAPALPSCSCGPTESCQECCA